MSQEVLQWSSVKVYQQGDPYFEDLITDIRQAQTIITMEVYIFVIDPLTLRILEELAEARRRGCRVHLLIDGFGSYFWLKALEKKTQRLNLQMRVFQTMPRSFSWFKRYFRFTVFKIIAVLRRLNRRNHRKVTLIDEKIAYLGSMNMTQIHSFQQMGQKAWKDMGVRLTGGSLKDLNRAFWVAWHTAPRMRLRQFMRRRQRDKLYRPQTSLVRLNATTWARFWLYRDLIRRIKTSQTKVWVETAYFLPRRSLLRALQKAAQRGVQVEVIVPFLTDVPLLKWAAEEIMLNLTQKGVRIYEYQPQVLHAKLLIIDNWTTVGSLNWNHRSFLHDLEVEAVFTEPETVKQITAGWLEDRKQSIELTGLNLRNSNFLKSWIGRLAFRLRYLL